MQKQDGSENRSIPWWIMGWKIWRIPVGLGIISTVIDLIYYSGELNNDWNCWGITILCILIALGGVKKIIPIINNNVILGAWIVWGISLCVWLARLLLRTSFHLHF